MSKTRIDGSGDLVADIGSGQVRFDKPVAYQNIGSERREVAANYALDGSNRVKFEIADYDRTQPLVIDPVLDYSTYLGGSATGDFANGIAVDAAGNAYLAGTTSSATFPVNNAIFATPGAGIASSAAFVTKLNPAGTAEVYSTYLSGDTGESGLGIAVDTLGNVYVTGQTKSTDFPTTGNAFSQSPIVNASGTGFLTKINPAGSALLYSTLLGGTNGDEGLSVAADAAGTGNAYVTGATFSGPGAAPLLFTVQGGFQATFSATGSNAFLVRIDTTQANAASLIYSTYLGGSTTDTGFGIAVDTLKSAYIVGTTNSSDFPAKNAFAGAPTNVVANGTVFLTKIDTTATGASSLLYSSYISGSATTGDFGEAIALGPTNLAYITGQTTSPTFPVTTGSYPSAASSQGIVFVTIVDPTKTGTASVTYSTLIGGTTGADQGFGIKVDTLGNAYVSGSTRSSDFPVTPGAFQSTLPGSIGDAFVLKLHPAGGGAADLLYSTYFGGSAAGPNNADTLAFGLALDSTNNVYITGQTGAIDLPTVTPFQANLTTSDATSVQSAFASKLTLIPTLAFAAPCAVTTGAQTTSCALPFGNQLFHTASTQQTFTVTNNTSSNITTINPTVGGTNSGDFSIAGTVIGGTSACSATLAAGASCGFGVTFTPSISGAESGLITVTYNYNNGINATATQSQLVAVSGTGTAPAVTLNPTTTLTFGSQPVSTTSAAQSVTVTNSATVNAGNLVFGATAATVSGDFALASGTTCTNSSTVAPAASCTINITFTPTATGTRAGTLTINDNVTGSPQTIALTGTGATSAPVISITPASPVTFGGQLVTTTSAAQTVTVKNTGNANLNLTATPVIGGTNASDFAIATSGTTCSTSTPVAGSGGTCTINITFTPPAGATGSRSATLTIADNASGSPQTVTLSGTAWDFSIAASPITVKQGSSGTINVTVTGLGGFTGAVTLSCTGAIPQGTCTAQSSPVTATAAGATGTVTITTHGSMVPPASRKTPPISTPQVLLVALAAMLLLMLPVAPALPNTYRLGRRSGSVGGRGRLLERASHADQELTQ